jgi:hypothetical protein
LPRRDVRAAMALVGRRDAALGIAHQTGAVIDQAWTS